MKLIKNFLHLDLALYLAWTVALSGTVLSLYFGEILGIEPCNLCWYQRICLFPLAIILGIGAYRDDRGIALYALPLAVMGVLFALYHTLGQWIPSLFRSSVCGHGQDCGIPVFTLFGFINFPLLSALGFVLILILLLLARKNGTKK